MTPGKCFTRTSEIIKPNSALIPASWQNGCRISLRRIFSCYLNKFIHTFFIYTTWTIGENLLCVKRTEDLNYSLLNTYHKHKVHYLLIVMKFRIYSMYMRSCNCPRHPAEMLDCLCCVSYFLECQSA